MFRGTFFLPKLYLKSAQMVYTGSDQTLACAFPLGCVRSESSIEVEKKHWLRIPQLLV